ncbi:MAG: carboxymuconolactone decarboxylase family protein [Archaeoglobus sp.]|uniref:carboxymuconolactone decarboxylase family protein n=1 Tax=Archaeoglobus sp. TaxID=1872626 RepID=UPI001E0E7ED7|nr:carboxymuconolactone decarboxylase family protein [Archaeoglobus sp.]MBO8179901.1 carboxymuconolactone decarboxylase family protein [Archaeoglobus sp.]
MSESNQEADIAETLRKMEEMIGEKPVPQLLMSKVVPEWIPRQMDERQFVMQLPNIPEKYKHLIMIAVAAAVGSKMCTEVFTKIAKRRGVTEREIGEAILIARFALASTIFATATPALEWLVGGDVE